MSREILTRILDLARWAPSGDNTQPWRFEIVGDLHIRVHGFDTRDHVLYDYDGHPSHIAHGALLETLRIAASNWGLKARWSACSTGDHRTPVYEVHLDSDPGLQRDPLFDCIERRMVQRRPMQITPLTLNQRQALALAVGEGFTVQWFESAAQRRQVAALLWRSARIRLICPEAYPVHKSIIEWGSRFSRDRIPEEAVGVDPLTARLMQWVMQSWSRVDFFNRYLTGTIAPRLQLDLLPGLLCAAHVLVRPVQPPTQLEDWVCLGMAVQRLWLTATQQSLHLQPQMTPVIFRWYARAGRRFSTLPSLFDQSLRLADDFERVTNSTQTDSFGFFARVGVSQPPVSRSIRLDVADLMKV
ncbi:nitroreductase family protein [Rhodoferax sp. BLA1]|uniref:nitroreductase family protein n=1 Tax=Rhodoferax sp. BLA1 TaxID=2576062 RepID=UPI0015D15893|nr:nitroreductase family protein [Rhodoferax sp. BLA1]